MSGARGDVSNSRAAASASADDLHQQQVVATVAALAASAAALVNENNSNNSNNSELESEEMVATERDLAEDAQWKKIQQNTFTRWANEHLKTVDQFIANLETDLSDGLRLVALIETLSGKRMSKHNKKPTFRSQKLENVSVALKFLEHNEGIKIVNIGQCSLFFSLFSLFSS